MVAAKLHPPAPRVVPRFDNDRIAYFLNEGVILQAGTPEQLASDEDVRTKYLGTGFVLKKSKSVERARREVEQEG